MRITIKDNDTEISIENFKKLLNIADKSGDKNVSIIWENDVHSDIDGIINELKSSKVGEISLYLSPDISEYDIIRTLQIQSEKNLNIIAGTNFFKNELHKNLDVIESITKIVSSFSKIRLSVEINLNYDGLYAKDAVEFSYKLGLSQIGFSIGLTDEDQLRNINPVSFYKDRMSILKEFLMECTRYHITPSVDCHSVPVCMYDDDMLLFTALTNYKNLVKTSCKPFIHIDPKMEMSRCYAYNKEKVSVTEFNDTGEIDRFYNVVFDEKAYSKLLIPECKTCASYILDGKSCGCLVMRGIKA
jgi:hypothetical protein